MRIVEDAKRNCGFAVPDELRSNQTNPVLSSSDDSYQEIEIQEYTLLDRIATILAYAGNKIDKDNLKESVLNVIEGLCQKYNQKVNLSDTEISANANEEEEEEERQAEEQKAEEEEEEEAPEN